MLCRHCHKNKANRPRGLCWSCYYTPGLKEQYSAGGKNAKRHKPTKAELDKIIAEQLPTMPPRGRDEE